MNSARKKIAKRMPEYSVWNPPTSSCSASTRSNGGWFVSATAATTKMTNATIAGSQYQSRTGEAIPRHAWRSTISRVLNVPALTSAPRMPSPKAASYDSIWADARTDPSSGYFEPLAQPASITP